MQDINLGGKLGGFLIELAEASNLPSQPPVIKVADVALQVHEVTAGPNKEGWNQVGSGSMGFSSPCPTVSACAYRSIM